MARHEIEKLIRSVGEEQRDSGSGVRRTLLVDRGGGGVR